MVLEVDFNDGAGFRPVTPGSQVSISYASTGTREIHIRASSGGATLEAAFELHVRQAGPDLSPDSEITNENAVAQYEGETVGYEHYGFYGDGNTSLQKPVIFLDGFDPGDAVDVAGGARGLEEIYEILNSPVEIDGVERRAASTLRREGYDLFILNYENGGDNIRRNAFTLVDLLEFINQKTSGSKKITVIGPSMGGLIARYALAYMEHSGIEHNVELFVSYDSPHQGANVPIGLQKLVDKFPISIGQISRRQKLLELPAARELIVYNSYDGTGISDPLREEFLGDLKMYGNYPTEPRMVAIANGDGYGQWQTNGDGETLNPSAEIFEVQLLDFPGLPYEYAQRAFAAPNEQEAKIFESAHYLKIIDTFFGEVKIKLGGITRYANTLPFDSAPGGWRDFAGSAQVPGIPRAVFGFFGGGSFTTILAAILADTYSNFPIQSFVSTVSALDYNTSYPQEYNLAAQDLFYPILTDPPSEQENKTPFDRIFAHDGNTRHVAITPRSYQFLLGEIRYAYRPVDLVLANLTISDTRVYEARETITAGPSFTVENGGDVTLKAGETITLRAGFHAKLGSSFYAGIDPSLGSPPEPTAPAGTSTLYASSSSSTNALTSQGVSHRSRSLSKSAPKEGSTRSKKVALQLALRKAEPTPTAFSLSGNFPNPFSQETKLQYTLPKAVHVSINVYDVLGRRVAELVNETQAAGYYRVRWDASGFPSGVYFYRMRAGDGFIDTKQMMLVR